MDPLERGALECAVAGRPCGKLNKSTLSSGFSVSRFLEVQKYLNSNFARHELTT